MSSIEFFKVTGTLQAIITDSTQDEDGEPEIQNISSFVHFTPNVAQVHSITDQRIYRLQPITARTQIEDGELRNIDGSNVYLVANNQAIDVKRLTYKVSFTKAIYDRKRRNIDSFHFEAPTTGDTSIDLATVEHIKP